MASVDGEVLTNADNLLIRIFDTRTMGWVNFGPNILSWEFRKERRGKKFT